MANVNIINNTEQFVTRHFTSSHIAYFDRTGLYRVFPARDRMLRTFADCIYVYGIVSVNGERYIRTGDTKHIAYKGRTYIGYPAVPLVIVLDTLYSRVECYIEHERYHLYSVNDYERGSEPSFVGIHEHEVNIR